MTKNFKDLKVVRAVQDSKRSIVGSKASKKSGGPHGFKECE